MFLLIRDLQYWCEVNSVDFLLAGLCAGPVLRRIVFTALYKIIQDSFLIAAFRLPGWDLPWHH